MAIANVPPARIRPLNSAPPRSGGEYVLYWMTAYRRGRSNFALQWAAEQASELGLPLLVLEPLRSGYRWASDRLHAFALGGMRANREHFARRGVTYHPYVEPEHGAGRGLLATLAARAATVVTDDFPCFFLPRMQAAAARALDVSLVAVDSNGLYPMWCTDRVFTTAASFRRHLQKELRPHLECFPADDPLADRELPRLDGVPAEVARRWPAADEALLEARPEALARLPIDHRVAAVDLEGGADAARARLERWVRVGLPSYHEDRSQPESEAPSGLSPWLHFGHISTHEVLRAVFARDGWTPARLADRPNGSRSGWWNASPEVEAFLDELITWRELGFNRCSHTRDYDRYESLPEFARETLEEHARDPRPQLYSFDELERADTHDEVWNAAQTELVTTGRMHNYLRMLWGKKVLEWSAWGPERAIFGKVRYMSSDSTRRKLRLEGYLERFGDARLF